MNFLINYLENKNKYGKLNININKKISKTEKLFLLFIFSGFNNLRNDFISIEINEIQKKFNFESPSALFDFVEKLSQKRVSYFFESNRISGSFPLFSSFSRDERLLNLSISKEIIESHKLNNFYQNQIL